MNCELSQSDRRGSSDVDVDVDFDAGSGSGTTSVPLISFLLSLPQLQRADYECSGSDSGAAAAAVGAV